MEEAATGVPLVCTHVLDPATGSYRDSEVLTGVLTVTAPFALEVDLASSDQAAATAQI